MLNVTIALPVLSSSFSKASSAVKSKVSGTSATNRSATIKDKAPREHSSFKHLTQQFVHSSRIQGPCPRDDALWSFIVEMTLARVKQDHLCGLQEPEVYIHHK